MAIQDETDYTLKGKQVKKIVQEIKESGTTYSAGTGLELTGTTFSVDNTIATKSEIPTVNNATLTIQKNSTSAGTFTANSATDTTINLTVPTTAADVSALPDSTKYGASITVAISTTDYKMTTTLKDQDGNTLGSAQVVDLPLESVVVNGSYDSLTKEVVLTLQNGNTIRFSVADLVSGLQTEITSSNKLSADLVDDSTTTNKFVTATDKTTWSGKQNALTAGSNITISGDTISATNTTYSDFVGATSGAAGTHGLVPAPASGDTDKYLKSDGSWATVSQYSLPAATANTLGGVKIGSNLSMDANDVLSATDTTYSAFTGTDGTSAGTAGLVPAPATTDAGKFLKADGTWAVSEGGIKTLTTADYNYPTTGTADRICPWLLNPGYYWVKAGTTVSSFDSYGNHSSTNLAEGGFILVGNAHYIIGSNQANRAVFWSDGSTVEGGEVHYNTETGAALMSRSVTSKGAILNAGWVSNSAGNQSSLVITQQAATQLIYPSGYENSKNRVRIGNSSQASHNHSVALGDYAQTSAQGEVNVGTGSQNYGYNGSNYRLLTGVYDPQSAHDAATKQYADTKATITMTTTDPGEGASIGANELIGVYS